MSKLSRADLVWNRAFEGGSDNPRGGDEAFAALLIFHAVTFEYGVPYAVGYLDIDDRNRAKLGYNYFRIRPAVKLLIQLEKMTQDELILNEVLLNTQYEQIIPDYAYLENILKSYLSANPFEFAPCK